MAKLTFFIPFILLLASPMIFSHGVGNEVTKTVNGYTAELGISDKPAKVNQLVTISLAVHKEDSSDVLAVENVWIRISKDDKVYFSSSNFVIDAGHYLLMTYAFPESGDYTVDVTVEQVRQFNIDTSLSVNVVDDKFKWDNRIFGYIFLLACGILLGYYIKSKEKQVVSR